MSRLGFLTSVPVTNFLSTNCTFVIFERDSVKSSLSFGVQRKLDCLKITSRTANGNMINGTKRHYGLSFPLIKDRRGSRLAFSKNEKERKEILSRKPC